MEGEQISVCHWLLLRMNKFNQKRADTLRHYDLAGKFMKRTRGKKTGFSDDRQQRCLGGIMQHLLLGGAFPGHAAEATSQGLQPQGLEDSQGFGGKG